ncbi:MAG TPA: hypothetical protein VFP12_07185 [Allosphingosinicella sp.]|nr:hypothetical protein [Allosphingosinicella sp.]
MTSGYSGTPLARKLSLKDGQRVWWDGMPESVSAEIGAEGLALDLLPAPEAPLDAAHIFVTDHDRIRDAIVPATGLVDVKVCAVDSIWSGLKLMARRRR